MVCRVARVLGRWQGFGWAGCCSHPSLMCRVLLLPTLGGCATCLVGALRRGTKAALCSAPHACVAQRRVHHQPASPHPPTHPPTAVYCGGGSVGVGLCSDTSLCCSMWGHCGLGFWYCSSDRGYCMGGPCEDYTDRPISQVSRSSKGHCIRGKGYCIRGPCNAEVPRVAVAAFTCRRAPSSAAGAGMPPPNSRSTSCGTPPRPPVHLTTATTTPPTPCSPRPPCCGEQRHHRPPRTPNPPPPPFCRRLPLLTTAPQCSTTKKSIPCSSCSRAPLARHATPPEHAAHEHPGASVPPCCRAARRPSLASAQTAARRDHATHAVLMLSVLGSRWQGRRQRRLRRRNHRESITGEQAPPWGLPRPGSVPDAHATSLPASSPRFRNKLHHVPFAGRPAPAATRAPPRSLRGVPSSLSMSPTITTTHPTPHPFP